MDLGKNESGDNPGDRDITLGMPELLTVSEVAALVRVSKMTIYRMIQKGDLPAISVGKSYRVPLAAVRRLTQSRGVQRDTHDEQEGS
jgi:excisionase family DNA binding protein